MKILSALIMIACMLLAVPVMAGDEQQIGTIGGGLAVSSEQDAGVWFSMGFNVGQSTALAVDSTGIRYHSKAGEDRTGIDNVYTLGASIVQRLITFGDGWEVYLGLGPLASFDGPDAYLGTQASLNLRHDIGKGVGVDFGFIHQWRNLPGELAARSIGGQKHLYIPRAGIYYKF